MNDRTCIVTRQNGPADDMIRFVADPEGRVVADLKAHLPGRGCWVTARRAMVQRAVDKKLFARALKAPVAAPADLADEVDRLIAAGLVGMMGLARKAGQLVGGAAKVEAAVRSGSAIAVLHAVDASADGVRKIGQARHARVAAGGSAVAAFHLLRADEMAVLGSGGDVIHVAVLAGQAGEGVVKRAMMLDRFRSGAEDGRIAGMPAEETETE